MVRGPIARARLFAVTLVLACSASSGPSGPPSSPELTNVPSDGQARLAVEVISGFARMPEVPRATSERVEVLVDVTPSMEARTSAGVPRHEAARVAADRLVRSLPASDAVTLHALGFARVDGCQPAFRTEESGPGEPRDPLYTRLENLAPGGEGSLALAIDGLRVFMAVNERLVHSRVVVFSDLASDCGGDLCEATSLLVAGGARVDFVVLGDEPAPSCLADFAPQVTWEPTSDVPPAPGFRAVRANVSSGRADILAAGRADGAPVVAPEGSVRVTVDLDPPLAVGPVQLSPNSITRLRILDFPALDPPVREWSWATTGMGTAAPGASGKGSAR